MKADPESDEEQERERGGSRCRLERAMP
jgi:hypothetical protein